MLPLTIAINPTKETNIQMILLEEDIQQLRKIKGTGEQTFNFSTLRAAFKWVSWQKVKSKPILNAACCLFITFQHYEETSCCIAIYKLFISNNKTQRNPKPERRGCLVVGKKGEVGMGGGGGKDHFGRLNIYVNKSLHSLESWFKKFRRQGKGKVTRGHQSPSPVRRFLFFFSFFLSRFMLSGFHHFVYSL